MQTKYNGICSALTGATDRNNDQCGKDMQVIAQKKHKQNRSDPVTQSCRDCPRESQSASCRSVQAYPARFGAFYFWGVLLLAAIMESLLLQQEVLLWTKRKRGTYCRWENVGPFWMDTMAAQAVVRWCWWESDLTLARRRCTFWRWRFGQDEITFGSSNLIHIQHQRG